MKKHLLLLVIILMSFVSFGQQNCNCDKALDEDLKDKFNIQNIDQFRSKLYEYYKARKEGKTHEESIKNLESEGNAYGTAFGGWFDSDQESIKNKFSLFEEQMIKDQFISTNNFYSFNKSILSDNQRDAYIQCIEKCSENEKSGIAYNISGNTSDVFTLTVLFKNNTFTNVNFVTLKDNAIFSNCEAIGGNKLKKGDTIRVNQSITQILKTIDNNKACNIAINFNEVNTKPIEVNKKPKYSSSPIGTIIQSVLSYDAFLQLNDITKTQKMSEAIWVPCDGRNVGSSAYGEFIGTVPDLRGLFVRGVNDYGVNFAGVSNVSSIRMNPENTKAGVFQNQQFLSHSHTLGDAGKADWDGEVNRNRQRVNNNGGNGITTSSSGGNETRPKNMSVYYYIKIN